MNAFVNHFSFEFRTGIRNKAMLLMFYFFPLSFFLLMGYLMPAINPPFLESLIPAMVVFATLAATLLGIPDPLVNARETGIFRSYKINGVPAVSILIIPALTTLLHLAIITAIITVASPLLFHAPLPVSMPHFALVFVAMAVACAGLGILLGVISSSTRSSVMWAQLVFVPSVLLGGLMVPYSLLPDAVAKIAQLLPASHAMNAFKGLAMGKAADFAPWGSVAVLLLGGTLSFVLALYLFSWDSHNAGRRGHPLLGLLALTPYVAGIFLFR